MSYQERAIEILWVNTDSKLVWHVNLLVYVVYVTKPKRKLYIVLTQIIIIIKTNLLVYF